MSSLVIAPSFLFERYFLVAHSETLRPLAFVVHGQFVDVGAPEDYAQAPEMFVLESHSP